VLTQFGIEITTTDYYQTYLGYTDVDCYKLLIDKGLINIDEQKIGELIEQKKQIFEELAKAEGRTIEGVHDFLKMLQQNNIPMAICSGSLLAEIELILGESGLRDFFAVIVSAEQVKKGKPHPDGFLLTLQKLNDSSTNPILPEECIVIEDSSWGLEAAKAAGMHSVAVTNSYDADKLSLADKIVTRLNELSIENLQQLCA
jgi:HAD superfamily hydrolase (TIGR01509 family)